MNCVETPQGNNYLDRIFLMDCIAGMKCLPDNSVDMVLCDLPYGVTHCRWDTKIPFDQLWAQYNRVCKDNGAVVLTCTQPFAADLISSNKKHFRYCWYWIKNMATGHAFSKFQPLRCVEEIAVFYRNAPKYNPQGVSMLVKPIIRHRNKTSVNDSIYRSDGSLNHDTKQEITNYPRQLLNFSCERGLHPTQKPVGLCEYLIRTYTDEGGVVLDNCMGSGTTAIACIRSGRHYIGYETDEHYYKICIDRIERETN